MSGTLKEEAIALYVKSRIGVPDGIAITLLHMSDNSLTVVSAMDNDVSENSIFTLPIGIDNVSEKYFKHNPPTEAEIENAIMLVEDEVMPLRKLLQPESRLISFDKDILLIAELAGSTLESDPIDLSVHDVESVFTRLAAIITGRPASFDVLPTTNHFAAILLILREFMHHIGFVKIEVLKH